MVLSLEIVAVLTPKNTRRGRDRGPGETLGCIPVIDKDAKVQALEEKVAVRLGEIAAAEAFVPSYSRAPAQKISYSNGQKWFAFLAASVGAKGGFGGAGSVADGGGEMVGGLWREIWGLSLSLGWGC